MDGNRRWAKARFLPPSLGHKEGINAVERTVDFCLKNGIPHLSLYAFSIENLNKRSLEEREYVFGLFISYFKRRNIETLNKKNVRVKFIGDRPLFPASIKNMCTEVEEKTMHGTALTIHFLFCYGGQQEIVAMVKQIAYKVKEGSIDPSAITPETIRQFLWLSDTPDPELIIRTGKAQRLSSFLPYQAAYSELFFTDTLWPDITETHLTEALHYFSTCRRNFGS